MANLAIDDYTAGSALVGTEIFEGVLSPFGAGDDRKWTATQIKTWCSASPTLATPDIGVAIGTSLDIGGTVFGNDAIATGSAGYVFWDERASLTSPADGILKLTNADETTCDRIQLGGETSSFPSIKRSGTAVHMRLADDSAFAPLAALSFNGNLITTGTGTLTLGAATLDVGAGGTLASAAFVATGTSGATIPLLNGTNTWSGQNIYARGTITTSQPHTWSQTWNAAGVTFEGALIDLTSTASATLSRALSVKVGGTEVAGIIKDGSVIANLGVWKSAATSFNGANYHGISFNTANMDFFTAAAATTLRVNGSTFNVTARSTGQYTWASTAEAAGTVDTGLQRSAAATVKVTNGSTGIGTILTKLPTADPGISGAMWNNAGVVAFSA